MWGSSGGPECPVRRDAAEALACAASSPVSGTNAAYFRQDPAVVSERN